MWCVRIFCVHGLEPASIIILYCTFEPDWTVNSKHFIWIYFLHPMHDSKPNRCKSNCTARLSECVQNDYFTELVWNWKATRSNSIDYEDIAWLLDIQWSDSYKISSILHRFSAFWLRSKCSICSYQLNIWYVASIATSILNWFLVWGEMPGACSALATGRPGIAVLPGMAHSIITKKSNINS